VCGTVGVGEFSLERPASEGQEQGVRKETKDNGGFETEHQGISGSNFSQHAATSETELPETLGGMC
jgi:hypothetical protein